jgi:hypothetical protein
MFFARSLLVAFAIRGALAQIRFVPLSCAAQFPGRANHPFTHSGVSTQCQNTLIAVAASPQSECLNPSGLLQIFVQSGSVVTPVDTWLKGLCSRGPCSNDDLAAIVTNVTSGCATDLQPILGNAQPGSLTPIVQEIYPTVRKAVCLAEYVVVVRRIAEFSKDSQCFEQQPALRHPDSHQYSDR